MIGTQLACEALLNNSTVCDSQIYHNQNDTVVHTQTITDKNCKFSDKSFYKPCMVITMASHKIHTSQVGSLRQNYSIIYFYIFPSIDLVIAVPFLTHLPFVFVFVFCFAFWGFVLFFWGGGE